MGESIKSKYKPSHPTKYKGDASNIICRSSWERKFCRWCDLNENILAWGSEEFCIPYISPCLLYTSPSPRDAHEPRMPSSA